MNRMPSEREAFGEVIAVLPTHLQRDLNKLPPDFRARISEIRLHAGKPLMLNGEGQNYFLTPEMRPQFQATEDSVCLSSEELQEVFSRICEYSVYRYQREIAEGYITLRGGHRAGICGTAVYENGIRTGLRDISSVNLRLARVVSGAADVFLPFVPQLRYSGGILLAGPPNSGKTTLLRDLARQLSAGICCEAQRVTVVDERGELAMTYRGVSQAGKDFFCDVLDGYPKAIGIRTAIRTLSPQTVVCDEIATPEEAAEILQGIHCGVRFALSVHASTKEELRRSETVQKLLLSGAFSTVILLAEGKPGRVREILQAGDCIAPNARVLPAPVHPDSLRVSAVSAVG